MMSNGKSEGVNMYNYKFKYKTLDDPNFNDEGIIEVKGVCYEDALERAHLTLERDVKLNLISTDNQNEILQE